MSIKIIAEHFKLSQKSRNTVETILNTILTRNPQISTLKLFLKRNPKNEIQANLYAHSNKVDLNFESTSDRLYSAIIIAQKKLFKKMMKQKSKILKKRKRNYYSENDLQHQQEVS